MSKKKKGSKKPQGPNKLTAKKAQDVDRKKQRTKQSRDINLLGEEKVNKRGKPISDVEIRGRGDSGKLLIDPHRLRSDLTLVQRAVERGWNVQRKTMIRRRLEDIANKTTADVVTKEGVVYLESKADELAIKAANILVMMDGEDLRRVKQLTESKDPKATQVVNVNVNNTNVNVQSDTRRIELAKLALKLGARELVIDGESVSCADIVGQVESIPTTPNDDGQAG